MGSGHLLWGRRRGWRPRPAPEPRSTWSPSFPPGLLHPPSRCRWPGGRKPPCEGRLLPWSWPGASWAAPGIPSPCLDCRGCARPRAWICLLPPWRDGGVGGVHSRPPKTHHVDGAGVPVLCSRPCAEVPQPRSKATLSQSCDTGWVLPADLK